MLDQIAAVEAARAAFQSQLEARNIQAPVVRALASAFTAFVRVTFGKQADVLGDFALAPRKTPPPRTLDQKLASAAKALATREARGTVGPKKKKAITGTVAPATAPVTPTSPTAPAVPAATTTATPPKA